MTLHSNDGKSWAPVRSVTPYPRLPVPWPPKNSRNSLLILACAAALAVNCWLDRSSTQGMITSYNLALPVIQEQDTVYELHTLAHPVAQKVIPITDIVKNPVVLNFVCHNQVLQRAKEVQDKTGLSVATIIGQKGVESGWGKSSLTTITRNLGNIKCACNWNKSIRSEHVRKKICRAAYDKIERSNDRYVILSSNWQGWSFYSGLIGRVYHKAAKQTDTYEEIMQLKKRGYGTDRKYVQKVWAAVVQNNLLELQKYIDEGYIITTQSGKYSLLKP